MMGYRYLDMAAYARRDEYDYFRSLAYPYVGVTVHADITPLHARVRAEGLPVFLSLLYVTSRAANEIPELRQRMRSDGIVEYDVCPTSHTVSLGGGRLGHGGLAPGGFLRFNGGGEIDVKRAVGAEHTVAVAAAAE